MSTIYSTIIDNSYLAFPETQFIFYIYAYIRKSNGTPYYIGKGQGNRAYDKAHEVNIPKDRSKIIFMETNLSEIGSLALERRYIRWYGRKDLGTGILHNRTDGGDGGSGAVRSPETRTKISESHKLLYGGHPEQHPWYGKKHKPESLEKIIASNKRRVISLETRAKMSAAKKGKPLSIEHRIKLGESSRKFLQEHPEKHPMSTPEARAKMSATKRRKNKEKRMQARPEK